MNQWSAALVQRHELFHISDLRDDFIKPKMYEAESWIESNDQAVPVTTGNLDAMAVLQSKMPSFDAKVEEKTNAATAAYENRAYADGAPHYTSLANSIP